MSDYFDPPETTTIFSRIVRFFRDRQQQLQLPQQQQEEPQHQHGQQQQPQQQLGQPEVNEAIAAAVAVDNNNIDDGMEAIEINDPEYQQQLPAYIPHSPAPSAPASESL